MTKPRVFPPQNFVHNTENHATIWKMEMGRHLLLLLFENFHVFSDKGPIKT